MMGLPVLPPHQWPDVKPGMITVLPPGFSLYPISETDLAITRAAATEMTKMGSVADSPNYRPHDAIIKDHNPMVWFWCFLVSLFVWFLAVALWVALPDKPTNLERPAPPQKVHLL